MKCRFIVIINDNMDLLVPEFSLFQLNQYYHKESPELFGYFAYLFLYKFYLTIIIRYFKSLCNIDYLKK